LKGGNNIKRQNGGRVVPEYKEQITSAIPRLQKVIHSQRYNENNPQAEYQQQNPRQQNQGTLLQNTQKPQPPPQQLVNLQVYQPTPDKKPPPKPLITPDMFTPFQTASMMFPPQFNPAMNNPVMPFHVIKNYNINTGGPMEDHTQVNMIYEDMLPDEKFLKNSTSLSERMILYDFIRSALFNKGDGQDMNLDGKKSDSLISKLKFTELNPYNTYRFSKNPYKGLPDKMLIYRSCYPIRYDTRNRCVTCASNSVAVNIRIYAMTESEFNINVNKSDTDIHKLSHYETWREMAFYEYIKNNIIKTNECPNFVTMYGYHLPRESKIDFDKIMELKGNPIIDVPKYLSNVPHVQDQENDLSRDNIQAKAPPFISSPDEFGYKKMTGGAGDEGKITVELDPNSYKSGRAMVIITEAPNYSVYGWASRIFQLDGNIHRVINTGFHTDGVWMSVLFQIMVAFYTMYKHKIYINNFSLENNVFIKDIDVDNMSTNYWKYIVNGIEYYVPNYGYMAMIDSSFADINKETGVFIQKYDTHKIYCPVTKDDDNDVNDTHIQDKIMLSFKESFANDNFSNKDFTDQGGVPLPERIKTLLSDVTANKKGNTKIGDYIEENMVHYINNRVGTYLKENEIRFIVSDYVEHKKGTIYVQPVSNDAYKFVMFISFVKDDQDDQDDKSMCNVYTKDDNSNAIITKKINATTLKTYNRGEQIVQDIKTDSVNLNESNIIETFIV